MAKPVEKAYKQRSIVLTVGLIAAGCAGLVAGAGVVVRFALPDAWDRGVAWTQERVDGPLLDLFRQISAQYVDQAPDLEGDARDAWKTRLGRMATALQDQRGTADLRNELRGLYDGITDRMKDGDLTGAELDPLRTDVDRVLEQIDTAEAQKKQ